MRRPLAACSLAFLASLPPACATPDQTDQTTHDAPAALTVPVDSYYVVLEGAAAVKRIPRGMDPRSPAAAALTRARVAEIEAQHAAIGPLLVQSGAVVIADLSRLANAVQVLADDAAVRKIEALPGVLRVERVPEMTRSLASAVKVVQAPALWASLPPVLGDGVRLGIIDSGIDYTHADFGGPGTTDAYLANDPDIIEPGSFPTAKVVGGWDFAGDAYNPGGGAPNPKQDPDPLDCTTVLGEDISGGHGTHVSGIAAGVGVLQDGTPFDGPYEASFDPSMFRVAPGVAPHADLYMFKVFGCQGSTTLLGAALDRVADPNNDGSMDDRLDVVNASLGSSYGLGTSVVGDMVKELTDLGTLVVAAAGNEGGNFFVVSSPSVYPEVLSVAAEVDNPLIQLHVTSPPAAEYPAAEAVFTTFLNTTLAGEIVKASPALGCGPLDNAAQVAGKIALIDRGTCPFVDKHANAEAAGAVGVVIIDNDAGAALPFQMGGADPGSIGIPGVMITQADGTAIESALANGPVTVELDPAQYTGPGAELLAGFSSRGPSPVDGRFKPEITAPGVIDSAAVGTGTGAVLNQGTSMASPMIAGAAALVRQARPGLNAYETKAALINSAVPSRASRASRTSPGSSAAAVWTWRARR
ncbi:MAG: S8 family serine peptidase [Polyangiaceae bacterium]